jgi:uncharacterized damage-inducible protein DinB
MGQRSEAIANQYKQAVDDLLAAVEAASDAQWKATCGDEQWTVAATAHHVGAQLPLEHEYLSAAADGKTMPAYTWDDINARNAKHAQEFASCSKAEAQKIIRENTAWIIDFVKGLSDEQLDRSSALPLAGGAQVTTEQLLMGGVLIEHATAHTASIRAAG